MSQRHINAGRFLPHHLKPHQSLSLLLPPTDTPPAACAGRGRQREASGWGGWHIEEQASKNHRWCAGRCR